MKNLLITFDVDGTLTKSGKNANRLHKRAFEYAFEQVFGVCGTVEAVPLHGKTDQMIILDCLEYYGIPRAVAKPRLKEVMDKMVEYCEENRKDVKQGLELLPGVLALLQCLSHRDDIVFGLIAKRLVRVPSRSSTMISAPILTIRTSGKPLHVNSFYLESSGRSRLKRLVRLMSATIYNNINSEDHLNQLLLSHCNQVVHA